MATTNHERVGRALDLLKAGLGPFVDRAVKEQRVHPATLRRLVDYPLPDRPVTQWDVTALIKVTLGLWSDVFHKTALGRRRHLLHELRDQRNRWAHQETFSSDDAYRAVDTVQRLLTAVSARQQAGDIQRLKADLLLHIHFEQQTPAASVDGGGSADAGEPAHPRRAAGGSRRSPDPSTPDPVPAPRWSGPARRQPQPEPEYACPIPGCTKVFHGTRGGWDAHVASRRMHPDWHPDVTDGEERKRRFRREYPRW